MENKKSKSHLRIRALCEGALMIALAQILSFIKLFPNLPNGGSITFAMFPICFYAVRWGLGRGLMAGFVFGLLQLIFDGAYAWGWQSMLLDYLVAYTALGLGGLFRGKAWGMLPCVAVGCLGRYAVHYLSGITLYRILEPTAVEGLESLGAIANAHVYSLLYNGVYMLPNTVIALVLAALLFAPLKKYYAGNDLRK